MEPGTSRSALAKRGGPIARPPVLPPGGRGLLATPAGAVLCELEPVGNDERGARYELRVTNGTDGTLGATASAIRVDERRPVAALAVEIEPQAAMRTGFSLDPELAYERVVAEIRGEGVHLIVEAPPPRGGRPRRPWVPAAFALGAAAVLAGATLIVVGLERPRVVDAALVASPGGELVARWATAGSGRRSYELRDARGDVVASGALPRPQGTLALGHGDAATLRVAVSNPFGSDARDAAYARATPPPPIRIVATPPPRIAALSVDPPRPGAPLTVRYAARGRGLSLAIVDKAGATWFRTTAPGGSGVTQVPAPPAGPREPYALVAAASGADGERTRVPIPAAVAVTPSPPPSVAPSSERAAGPVAVSTRSHAAVVDVGGGDDFSIRPEPVAPGKPFAVEIPFADGARVALVRDRDGAEVAGADLRAGERSVALAAPTAGGSYTVRVTLQRGEGVETLVRPLRLAR